MSNSNIELTLETINSLEPLEIVKDDKVRSRFIQIYDTLWGAGSGLPAYEKESVYFNRILADNPRLYEKATRFSIFTAFIDLAVSGLSLEPGSRALCYLQGRNYCTGQNTSGRKTYEGRLSLTISGYGELVLRARSGQIAYTDNPVIVYSEDEFSFSDKDGRKSVSYTCHLPHTSNHIVAAFLRIVRNDGSADYAVMFEEDWMRLQNYSAKNNTYRDSATGQMVSKPNELYCANEGGIDPGFLCAKLIKHAFRSYPKVRIGKATELQSQQEDAPVPDDDFYGVKETAPKADPAPAYGPAPDYSAGVQVDDPEDGAF